MRSLPFGAYLTSQWVPAKKLHPATSTYRGYERNVQRHIMPALGEVSIRRLRYQQIEALYDTLLHPTEGKGLSPKTVYEIHLVIKAAIADALRRGLVTRNVAVVARAPKQRSLQRIEGVSLTEDELRQLLRTAVGHRLFPLYWLTAITGMRRNEVLGLKWLSKLLRRLNPVLRGWTNYFRHGVSKATFGYLRAYTWARVVNWLRRKHPRANWKWLRRRHLKVVADRGRGNAVRRRRGAYHLRPPPRSDQRRHAVGNRNDREARMT